MDWKNISGLLKNAAELLQSNYVYKKAVADALNESLRVDIEGKNISLKNGVVYIKADPLIKGEILLNKADIIASIYRQNPLIKIDDIR